MKSMLHHFFSLCFLLLLALPVTAAAQQAVTKPAPPIQTTPEDLELIAVGTLESVPRADQIKVSNGKTYILDNIRIPVHMEASIRDYIERNFVGKKIGVFTNPQMKTERVDEKGNMLVHVVTDTGSWLQGSLVSRGLSWAYSTQASRDLVVPLYALEQAARKARAGMWRDPDYAVRTDKNIAESAGSFQVYEGTVESAATKGGFSFINFGRDHARDFTALILAKDITLFERNYRVESLVNQIVRLRGWVEQHDSGPIIYVTHPEQMEVLGVDPKTLPAEKCVAGPGQFCPDQGPPPNHMKIQ